MSGLNAEKLKEILRSVGGSVVPEAFLDVPFGDMGYDSLAVMETNACVEREYGVALPEDTVTVATTPRLFIDTVNEHLMRV